MSLARSGDTGKAEEDASGQGRMLINDRNWKTVAAGTVVDCNTQIKLSATKIDG